jgi:anthranilate 1,2-dioxygenase large subunit
MNRIESIDLGDFEWPGDEENATEVPGRVFYDPAIYQREQEKIFRGEVWNFVGLEVEIPQRGDYKTVYIGDTPVVLVRGDDEQIHCWVNRCSHRNANIVLDNYGNSDGFYCVYHQWGYGLDGTLESVTFKRGLGGKGGMSECFDQTKHRPRALQVESFHGVIFASFSDEVEPLEEYLAPLLPNL